MTKSRIPKSIFNSDPKPRRSISRPTSASSLVHGPRREPRREPRYKCELISYRSKHKSKIIDRPLHIRSISAKQYTRQHLLGMCGKHDKVAACQAVKSSVRGIRCGYVESLPCLDLLPIPPFHNNSDMNIIRQQILAKMTDFEKKVRDTLLYGSLDQLSKVIKNKSFDPNIKLVHTRHNMEYELLTFVYKCCINRLEKMKLLLQAGTNPNLREWSVIESISGKTILHQVASKIKSSDTIPILKLLMDPKIGIAANPNLTATIYGRTAYDIYVRKLGKCGETVEELAKKLEEIEFLKPVAGVKRDTQ